MKKQPAIENNSPETTSTETLTVLSISPHSEDHSFLEGAIGHFKRTLLKVNNVCSARATLLQRDDISVVVCECDLMPGSWTDILKHIQSMSNRPSLIVTSRLADDRLWSVVLNHGGWDVLQKPFSRAEVLRSIKLAWEHWRYQIEIDAGPMKVMQAG